MAAEDLTLDEMFLLEREHPPLVGRRTSVFLDPLERATAATHLDDLYAQTQVGRAEDGAMELPVRKRKAAEEASVSELENELQRLNELVRARQAQLARLSNTQCVFGVGDTVRVHSKVVEGDKERIQIFAGVVIGRRGRGLNECFTVRKISYGEGVERVFAIHSPRVEKIEVERKGAARRAKFTDFHKHLAKGAPLTKATAASLAPREPNSAGKHR